MHLPLHLSMRALKPFILERLIQTKVWGGQSLEQMFGITGDNEGDLIGETWELYDRPDGSSGIRGGGSLRDIDLPDAENKPPRLP